MSTTEFQVLWQEYNNGKPCLPVMWLLLKPITGRAHKLLVYCAAVGHPIVGDPSLYDIYGEASPNDGISEVYIMDALSPHRASLELQRQLNTALPPVFSTMCLHAKELSLTHHPVT